MPGQESHFFKKETSEEMPRETPSKSLEQIEQELREKGAKKEDIDSALGMMKRMSFLDRKIFPENPAVFTFALKESPLGNFAGFVRPEGNGKERFYQIVVKNLAKFMEGEKDKKVAIFSLEGRIKHKEQFSPEFLIAAHEVRHRVQHDHGVKQFSPEDAESADSPLLRNIIKFTEMVFEERKNLYLKENKLEEFIKEKLGPKEFDAAVIERLVGSKLNEILKRLGSAMEIQDLYEIISMIQMSAPERSKI